MGLLSIKRCLPASATRFNTCRLHLPTRTNQRKPTQTPQPRKAAVTTTNSAIITTVLAATTIYAATLTALMTLAPSSKPTQHIMRTPSLAPLVPLALAYGFLLLGSWQPDTFSLLLPGNWEDGFKAAGFFSPQFFPNLPGIMTLFSRSATAASLWVHILAVNMFVARSVYVGSSHVGLMRRLVIVCCATFAPIGLLLSELLLSNVGDTI